MKYARETLTMSAIVVIAVIATLPPWAQGQTSALRPDQARALEIVLAEVEPDMRPLAREQMTRSLSLLDEAQIRMMLDALAAQSANNAQQASAEIVEAPSKEMTPEDRAYNRSQYEPVIREAHAVQVDFDKTVRHRLARYCPTGDSVARWGSAWRYEFARLKDDWRTATDNADIDVEVLDASYAPQDGRYTFDFSKVRLTFDTDAVNAAVKKSCLAYEEESKAFLTKLDELIAKEDWDGAFRLEQTSSGRIEPIRTRLDNTLNTLSPAGDYALLAALQNAKRVK